ncbi:HNH endonuclease signature motif containing protein [Streptomyces sp. NPDC052051]|uniref:HNH endonuclease signature motif containing protein n=1 Tax=Streptomyces sp. NPDC052051 TaxID=3154649 RepID=UPI0034365007
MRVELDEYDAKALRRLQSKIELAPESGCWCFTGGKIPAGYGMIGYRQKQVYAHRLSYELFIGPIPEGLEVDHVKDRGCCHRSCINPKHLEAVSRQENIRRSSVGQHNAAKTHCPQGHEYSQENTYNYGNGRICKKCLREAKRKYVAKKRKEASNAA